MLPLRDFWRRHKKKIYVTLGVAGCGYFAYRLYDTHRNRLSEIERQLEAIRKDDEFIKSHLQERFEDIQRIGDTAVLPHALELLSRRVAEELDVSALTERLQLGKGQPSSLSPSEKLELWERIKISSFTRLILSLWGITVITLYVRVLVNMLGRHMFVDRATVPEEYNLVEEEDEAKFIQTSEYLPKHGMHLLLPKMLSATTECLKSKQLREIVDATVLHEIITQILEIFMSNGKPACWVEYLMPEALWQNEIAGSSSSGIFPQVSKFNQLILETKSVLSSPEFINVMELSLKAVAEGLVKEVSNFPGAGHLSPGIPLVKFLPMAASTSSLLLHEPTRDQFINIIRDLPDVNIFFTLLYTGAFSIRQ